MGIFGNPFHSLLHMKVLISEGELPDRFDSTFERLVKQIASCTSVALPPARIPLSYLLFVAFLLPKMGIMFKASLIMTFLHKKKKKKISGDSPHIHFQNPYLSCKPSVI